VGDWDAEPFLSSAKMFSGSDDKIDPGIFECIYPLQVGRE